MSEVGHVVWLTGLPSSGKSTLARAVAAALQQRCVVLDGDEVRAALVPRPSYDETGRDAFYGTLAGLAALLARQGNVVVVAATAHRRAWREDARRRAPRFTEVWVRTSLEECRARDAKGLYAAGAATLPGLGVTYEPPLAAEVIAEGGQDAAAIAAIVARVS